MTKLLISESFTRLNWFLHSRFVRLWRTGAGLRRLHCRHSDGYEGDSHFNVFWNRGRKGNGEIELLTNPSSYSPIHLLRDLEIFSTKKNNKMFLCLCNKRRLRRRRNLQRALHPPHCLY